MTTSWTSKQHFAALSILAASLGFAPFAMAQSTAAATQTQAEKEAELVKKTLNPVASLISLPLQYNYDGKMGATEDGSRQTLNIQPVIPVSISKDWNLISRTILPVVEVKGVSAAADASGLGDTVQSFFFSPKSPAAGGLIWGVGPVLVLPTGTPQTQLGSGKWSAGATAVALLQDKGWTLGFLGNHVWSFAGQSDRNFVNSSYYQPFLAYSFPSHTTLSLNTESTYDWTQNQWSVPINFAVAQMLKTGGQLYTVQLGARYWAESPNGGPKGWGARFALTLLYPD